MEYFKWNSSQHLLTILVVIFAFFTLSFQMSEAASIGLDRKEIAGTNPPVKVAAIVISGQIQYGDAKKVEDFLLEINQTDDSHQILRLLIHSQGGYVGEAIRIGKLLRGNNVEVFIPQQASCISACVLILAGGARRTILGKVGIDYPHFLKAAGANDDVPALLAEVKQVMRDYFQSMGVASELSDGMFSVPEGIVHFLSQDELIRYKLKAKVRP